MRRLAIDRLARLGSEAGIQALVEQFGRVDPDEGEHLLDALAEVKDPAVVALYERVLLEEPFDGVLRAGLREMAAWSLYRNVGADAFPTLRASFERREGRNARVAIYMGLAGGREALPVLAATRVSRLKVLKWSRGQELEALDRLVRAIEAGRKPRGLEVPPTGLDYSREMWNPSR